MDATSQTLPLGKSTRLRRWVAIVVVASLFALIVCKDQYTELGAVGSGPLDLMLVGSYGCPLACIDRRDFLAYQYGTGTILKHGIGYDIVSWPSLLLDIAVLIGLPSIAWLVLCRTQRHCERWNQISLATILALVALAAVACAIWKSSPTIRPEGEAPAFDTT